jgi:tetratricopeptide (TPR) repeat protein
MKTRRQPRHVRDCDIQAFAEDRLPPTSWCRISRHLIAGCPACSARLLDAARGRFLPERPECEDAYDACLDRVEAALPQLTAAWQDEAKRRDAGVARVQAKSWGNLTPADRRPFSGRWGGVEMLLELSFAARFRDRILMLRLAQSAQRAAWRLTPSPRYRPALLADLRARAVAEVANAERVNEYFLRAGESLQKARALAQEGTGDPMLQARLDEVEGTLRNAERHIEEADILLDQAYRAYLRQGAAHLAGRILVKRGLSRFVGDDAHKAVEIFRRAISLLDPAQDSYLSSIAQYNLALALVETSELEEAGRLLLQGDLRRVFARDPLNLIRLRWLEGKLLAARGRSANAVRVLTEVRDAFRAQGLEYVAAVAGVDLAKVYLEQKNARALHATAVELVQRAHQKKLSPHAQHALVCFEVMCDVNVAEKRHATFLQKFLHDVELHPGLRFKPEMMVHAAC